MKNLKHIVALLFILGLVFSCTKENFESPQQIGISEFQKQQIRESSEFIEMQNLNSRLMTDIAQKLLSNPVLIDHIIELNYTNSEMIDKLEINDELFQYEQQIINLNYKIVSAHPILSNFDVNEKQLLVSGLLLVEREKQPKKNTSTGKNSCQQRFERDFQYIHGQYDSAIMGSAIAIVSGKATSNPISIGIGAGVSVWAVGRAIYGIAVAIDDYNNCIGGNGGNNNVRLPCDVCKD